MNTHNSDLARQFDEKIKQQIAEILARPDVNVDDVKEVEKIMHKFNSELLVIKLSILKRNEVTEVKKTLEEIKAIK